jgi:hypothetical protein
MGTQIAYKCGLHKHRSPEAARECFLKNFFVNFEKSIQQCREEHDQYEREHAHVAQDPKLIPEVLPLGSLTTIDWLFATAEKQIAELIRLHQLV